MDLSPCRGDSGSDDPRIAALLFAAMTMAEASAADTPHVVVCRSRRSGSATFRGPFQSALAALASADIEERAEQSLGNSDLSFSVVRLFPPTL